MIFDLIATAAPSTPAVLQSVSVLASIGVALLTIGGVLVSILFFVFKVHTSTIANTKAIEGLRLKTVAYEVEHQRLTLLLVGKGVITGNEAASMSSGSPS